MSNLVFSGFKDSVKLMPITRALFHMYDMYDEDEYIIIDNLEAESSYKISPITRQNFYGQNITLGYNYEINLYVPHNLYFSNGLLERVEALNTKNLVLLYLVIGYGGGYVPPEPMPAINYNAKQILRLSPIRATIEIESVQYRPRAIIKIVGFKKDLNELFIGGEIWMGI